MATENADNVRFAREIYDDVNRSNFSHLGSLYADDVKLTSIPINAVFDGRDSVLDYVRLFKRAFPDLNLAVQRQMVKDNTVVNEYTATGTHQGPLASPLGEISPTGRRVEIPVIEVQEFKNGKLKNSRQYWNAALLLDQLGALGPGTEQRIH